MIGIDTNVLVRYLAQDDATQSAKATALIEGRLTAEAPGFVSLVAMVETVWVLDRAYGLTGVEIAGVIEALLQAQSLVIQDEQAVFEAKVALRRGTGSFADALIGALGRKAGCTHTVTFDRKAQRLDGFVGL